VLRENGFDPEFGKNVDAQVAATKQPAAPDVGVRDLRGLLWSSIDNTESRDLDQIEVAERLPTGAIRILIAIADVDALVGNGSPADLHALTAKLIKNWHPDLRALHARAAVDETFLVKIRTSPPVPLTRTRSLPNNSAAVWASSSVSIGCRLGS